MNATLLLLAAASLGCEPVPGAEPLLRPGAVVLLGEIHGTEQSPRAVSNLACLALEKNLRVRVALEIPRSEQERIDRFLNRSEPEASAAELLAGEFWQRKYQDGRSSAAMLELLETLRRYREITRRVDAVAIDDPEAETGRDAAMAGRLDQLVSEEPEALVLALVGNVHNRLTVGTSWKRDYEPLGYLFSRRRPGIELTSLRFTHGGGAAWICTGSEPENCGVRELRGEAAAAGVELFPEAERDAFSGVFHLGPITPSPPAR